MECDYSVKNFRHDTKEGMPAIYCAWREGRHSKSDMESVQGEFLRIWPDFQWINVSERTIIMHLTIDIEQEEDGRWLSEVLELPGVMAYGETQEEAIVKVQTLTLRVLADRLEHGETVPEISAVFSAAA